MRKEHSYETAENASLSGTYDLADKKLNSFWKRILQEKGIILLDEDSNLKGEWGNEYCDGGEAVLRLENDFPGMLRKLVSKF